jgi:hypothetical protein
MLPSSEPWHYSWVRLKKERVRRETDEVTRRERMKDAEIAEYNPWGKGGCGAPLRDAGGNLVADLRGAEKHGSGSNQKQHQHHQGQSSPRRGGGNGDYPGGHGDGGFHARGGGGRGGEGGGIPGLPGREINASQSDYSSPLRRAGGGPSSFRIGGGGGGGIDPPTPRAVNALVAGPRQGGGQPWVHLRSHTYVESHPEPHLESNPPVRFHSDF